MTHDTDTPLAIFRKAFPLIGVYYDDMNVYGRLRNVDFCIKEARQIIEKMGLPLRITAYEYLKTIAIHQYANL